MSNSNTKMVRIHLTIPENLYIAFSDKARELRTSKNRLGSMILEWGIPKAGGRLSIDIGDNSEPGIIGHEDES